MRCNYPIKYAAMPMIEQIGWSPGGNELERKFGTVCYIVSKCYLLGDTTIYNENGKRKKEYEIVFPYHKEQYYDWKKVIPEFNLMNGRCTNSDIVEEVFDNYEDALEVATQKNKELCEKTWVYLPYTKKLDKQIDKKIEEFNDKLSQYKMLEEQILINTADLEQSNVRELDKVIFSRSGEIKTLSGTLYESYLKTRSYFSFIIYSISQEQYNNIVASINYQTLMMFKQ